MSTARLGAKTKEKEIEGSVIMLGQVCSLPTPRVILGDDYVACAPVFLIFSVCIATFDLYCERIKILYSLIRTQIFSQLA